VRRSRWTVWVTLGPGLVLPVEAVTETFSIPAKRGAGKAYSAAVLVEEVMAAGLPLVIVDPVGVWRGLRSSADGTAEGQQHVSHVNCAAVCCAIAGSTPRRRCACRPACAGVDSQRPETTGLLGASVVRRTLLVCVCRCLLVTQCHSLLVCDRS